MTNSQEILVEAFFPFKHFKIRIQMINPYTVLLKLFLVPFKKYIIHNYEISSNNLLVIRLTVLFSNS